MYNWINTIFNKDKVLKWFAIASSVCIIIYLLISSVSVNAMSKNFYAKTYKELEIASTINMSDEDLMKATTTLFDYLKDKTDNIDTTVRIHDVETIAFNEKEIAHMKDVKNLYQNAMTLKNITFILGILMISIIVICRKKESIPLFATNFIIASVSISMFLIVLIGWVSIDFDSFWTSFHKLFFSNDLWLLDPNADLLIQMYPSQFFLTLIIKIVITFILFFATILGSSIYAVTKERKRIMSNSSS